MSLSNESKDKDKCIDKLNSEQSMLVAEYIEYAEALVFSYIKKNKNLFLDIEELKGAAFLGLCYASLRYKKDSKVSFKTFAYFRVKGAILDYVRENGVIPKTYFSKSNSEEEIQYNIKKDFPFASNIQDFIALSDILLESGIKLQGPDGGRDCQLTYSRQLNPEQEIMKESALKLITAIVKTLPEDEQKIFQLRFAEQSSLKEIEKEIGGISKSTIHRLGNQAVAKVKSRIKELERECRANLLNYEELTSYVCEVNA